MNLPQLNAAREYGLNLSTLATLLYLDQPKSATIGSIAQAISLSSAAMTGAADRLVALGFVDRRYGADRRTVWVDLNERGVSALADIRKEAA